MRIFPHANVINFQASIREMTAPELERLLKKMMTDEAPMMAGFLDTFQEAVYIYGTAESVSVDEERDRVEVTARSEDGEQQSFSRPFSGLILSHEMRFDIEVEGQVVSYPVYYATFAAEEEQSREITLFLAPTQRVPNPLECVVEFWEQGGDVGRDVEFTGGGCSIPPDFKKLLNPDRSL
ncbi:hypothetical protein ACFQ49_12690 [Kroppenstedtia eburnea]|uniref:Uncharacterized protein n=1 Tax=Kroppenstedtia eburnea TaxID=714067 RepID=A0A1N7KIH8_9BACL|nr:hypothetical protein [Kroppenstedtia eburnea]EGK06738.1 hypothetical protein HMPREF9374_4042 [Desmospora sp. 8437]QKI82967.1 hypothetical protein GXN75_13720 [Kroppenstedtia eburnea]SIS61367.1 hypothetical protein SAMN05421790_10392 [Kroppenstedtia eburnea]